MALGYRTTRRPAASKCGRGRGAWTSDAVAAGVRGQGSPRLVVRRLGARRLWSPLAYLNMLGVNYVLTYFKVMLRHINIKYLVMSILFSTFAHIKIYVLPLEVAHDTNLV